MVRKFEANNIIDLNRRMRIVDDEKEKDEEKEEDESKSVKDKMALVSLWQVYPFSWQAVSLWQALVSLWRCAAAGVSVFGMCIILS